MHLKLSLLPLFPEGEISALYIMIPMNYIAVVVLRLATILNHPSLSNPANLLPLHTYLHTVTGKTVLHIKYEWQIH